MNCFNCASPALRSSSIVEAPVSRVGRLLPRGSAAFLKHILIARGEVIAKVANYLGNLTSSKRIAVTITCTAAWRPFWAGGKEESRWRGGFRRLVLAPRGLTGLLSPSVKSGRKLFQPYFMNCFNCASPRCVGPPIMRQPKFPLACALFTTLCLKIDNKACLKNTFVRRNSQSIVGSDRTRTFLRDTRARGAGGQILSGDR